MVHASVIAALLVVSHASEPKQEWLTKVSLEHVDPLALCTDGSHAVYYYKAADALQENASSTSASAQDMRTWLVYLEGGGWCTSEESCNSRCDPKSPDWKKNKALCTSNDLADGAGFQGIFTPATNKYLKNAHKVYVNYCTSDAHMGDGEAFHYHSEPEKQFQFRGQRVVKAVLKDLVESQKLGSGLAGRDRVIFGGYSAGARGAMVHLDYVQEELQAAGAANVDVIGFLDSPAYLQMNSSFPKFELFPEQTKNVSQFANVTHFGTECESKYSGEEWKCLYGQYRLPTIQTPFMFIASQYDSYFLGNHLEIPSHGEQIKEDQSVYADEYAAALRQLNKDLSMKDGVGVYSWACYNHAMSARNDGFNQFTCDPNSTTVDVAFEQYLTQMAVDNRTTVFYQDDCGSFNCSLGCGKQSQALDLTEVLV